MYTPSDEILQKYAEVLVKFALHNGKGMKRGEVVRLFTYIDGLPLAEKVYQCILENGGNPLIDIRDDNIERLFYKVANKKQLTFFPEAMLKARVNTVDHGIAIFAEKSPLFMKDVDPAAINLSAKAYKPYRDWLDKKEDQGRYTWTLCSYATPGKAKEAGMSLKAYWNQIIKSCFLEEADPVKKWQQVLREINRLTKKLSSLPIERVHVESLNTDIWITLGEKRKWVGGGGANVPSFEIFTSPDWRGTEGTIYFDQPLYTHGNIVKGITLKFEKGRIVEAIAEENQEHLDKLIEQKNADKIGEFSLTDRRFSGITRFMADVLFDENFGGKYGNTHLAVGASYHETYDGNSSRMTEKRWEALGFNDSAEHADIVSTANRTVTAVFKGGKDKVIYKDGQFTI